MDPFRKSLKSFLLIIPIIITTSCAGLATPTPEVIIEIVKETVIVIPTPISPTSTPEPDIIFTDDFSDIDSGWSVGSTDVADKFYEDGLFHIDLHKGASWSSNLELSNMANFVFDTDIKELKKEGNGGFTGIMFGYSDNQNYTSFGISSDGLYAVFQEIDGEFYVLAGPSSADHINLGNMGNHIQIIVEGSKVSIYTNGELTYLMYDELIRRGDINLFAISGAGDDSLETTFDNVVVARLR